MTSHLLKVGDRVTTDYDKKHSGITEHVITRIRHGFISQSGTQFQVDPLPRLCNKNSWIDADWFTPVNEEKDQ